jgi:hypothetical protein
LEAILKIRGVFIYGDMKSIGRVTSRVKHYGCGIAAIYDDGHSGDIAQAWVSVITGLIDEVVTSCIVSIGYILYRGAADDGSHSMGALSCDSMYGDS